MVFKLIWQRPGNYKTENECWVIVNRCRPKYDEISGIWSYPVYRAAGAVLKPFSELSGIFQNPAAVPGVYRAKTRTLPVEKKRCVVGRCVGAEPAVRLLLRDMNQTGGAGGVCPSTYPRSSRSASAMAYRTAGSNLYNYTE